jgi:DNA-binding FrmR family transcriptional regulator
MDKNTPVIGQLHIRKAPMATTIQADLIHRLRSAEGHLRGIIGMIEAGEDCPAILEQVLCVQHALRMVDRLLLIHHLSTCLREELSAPEMETRERALASVVELYRLVGGEPPVADRKELV